MKSILKKPRYQHKLIQRVEKEAVQETAAATPSVENLEVAKPEKDPSIINEEKAEQAVAQGLVAETPVADNAPLSTHQVLQREKVLLFYNPYSGNGLFKNNLDRIIAGFQDRGMQIIPIRSGKDNPLENALHNLDLTEFSRIIAAGGDGTINVCVNTMLKAGVDLPLGIFPVGTANDFAYYFDIPHTIDAMVETAAGNHYTYSDVGVCNGRYFINVAALGALVDVSQKTDPNLKNTLGVLSYYLKGVSELPNVKPLPVTLTTKDQVYNEKMLFMVVMNGRSAGGFKNISPDSEINDGKLNVILFRDMPILELGPLFINVLQGNHKKSKKVLTFSTEELTIESPEAIPTDVDGEHGEKLPLYFKVLPRRLRILTTPQRG